MSATILVTKSRKEAYPLLALRFSRRFSRQSVATKCRERRTLVSGNPAIYPAKMAGYRYLDKKPDMVSGWDDSGR